MKVSTVTGRHRASKRRSPFRKVASIENGVERSPMGSLTTFRQGAQSVGVVAARQVSQRKRPQRSQVAVDGESGCWGHTEPSSASVVIGAS
jgi:hypothetical protein